MGKYTRFLSVLAVVVATTFGASSAASARVFGDVTLGAGGTWPQGSFAAYGDPGPQGMLRVTVQIPQIRTLMGWWDATFTHFSTETTPVEIEYLGRTFPADQNTSQDCLAFHLGLQVGNHTRRGFFRPHAGLGMGLYFFFTDVSLKEVRIGGEDEEVFSSDVTDSQELLGWRGQIGSDFFFTPKWGLTFDLLYDHVWNLNRKEGDTRERQTSRFQGFTVGVVVPFGTMAQ